MDCKTLRDGDCAAEFLAQLRSDLNETSASLHFYANVHPSENRMDYLHLQDEIRDWCVFDLLYSTFSECVLILAVNIL